MPHDAAPARALARLPIALCSPIALALWMGCSDEAPAPPPAGSAGRVEAPAVATARRPTRRFYLARAQDRCEIYAEDGDDRTEPLVTPCPEYMMVGERIRIAGRACMLDNEAQPEREKPVVCPDPLTHFEKRERGLEK